MSRLSIDVPPALLQDGNFCSQLVRTLANLIEDSRAKGFGVANATDNLQGSDEVDIRGHQVDATAFLEGHIQVATPFRDGEVQGRGDDATVKFSASLRFRVERSHHSGDDAAKDASESNGTDKREPVHGFPLVSGVVTVPSEGA